MSSMPKNSKAQRQSKAQIEDAKLDSSQVDLVSEFDALVSMIDTASSSQHKSKVNHAAQNIEQSKEQSQKSSQQAHNENALDKSAHDLPSLHAQKQVNEPSDQQDGLDSKIEHPLVNDVVTTTTTSSSNLINSSFKQNEENLDKSNLKKGDPSLNSVELNEDVDSTADNDAEALLQADDSSVVADENSAIAPDILGELSKGKSKQRSATAHVDAENISSTDGKLNHVSGKTFELSEIFPDIKYLSSAEQTRLNKEFISGLEGSISQLFNSRLLERLGGSEFGIISIDKIKALIEKTQGELKESAIVRLHSLFTDCPNRQQLVNLIKNSPAYLQELVDVNFIDVEHPLSLLTCSEGQMMSFGFSLEAIKLRSTVAQSYMAHEEHLINAIKSYKFDPTTNEYQELVFYYYLLATHSSDFHYFNLYHKLVDLQNLFLLFKIFAGAFLNNQDLQRVVHDRDLSKLSSYTSPSKVDTSRIDIHHFIYLRSNLKRCLESDAPYYLEFLDKLANIVYKDTKRTYFSEGLPFDFGFIPALKSYLLSVIVDFLGKESLDSLEKMDEDTERRPMMYYDIFFRQNQDYLKHLPEFEMAMQDIGSSLQGAIKNNEITPRMREWAFHLKHQVDIFKTLDRLDINAFDVFYQQELVYCSPLYCQLYYQQLAFYSKYKLNIKRKRDFVQNLIVHHLNLLNQGHYIEALSSEYTQDAKVEFRSMLAKRRGLFANIQQYHEDIRHNVKGNDKSKLSESSQDYDPEQATAFIGATTLDILREGSTVQRDALISVEEMEILAQLRLEQSEIKALRQTIKASFKRLYLEHLTGNNPMDLDKGQYIGDYGVVPIIPGISAHTAFLIARAMHFGDFGLHNQQMARVGFFYADLTGHYLASMFVVNLYSALFDSNLSLHGNLYGAYLIRSVFAGNLTAYSDECLFGQRYLQVHERLFGFLAKDKDELEPALDKHKKDSPNHANFLSFVKQIESSPKIHLGSSLAQHSPQVQRLTHIFKNNVSMFLSPEYGETYYQSLAVLSTEYYEVFKRLNPNFGIHQNNEGEPLNSYNQFHMMLSNAVIYLLDVFDEHLNISDTFTLALHGLLSQLYSLMVNTQSPHGCLALYKYLSINKTVEMARIDQRFESFFDTQVLSKIIYVQLFGRQVESDSFGNHFDEFNDFSQIGNIFWQLAMCLPDLREQGYNLLDRSLSSIYGNFYPCRYPDMDEFVKSSAALHNSNSLSYLTAINHQMGNHEQAELFALIANSGFSFKAYRDVVRYCIKHDLNELRLAIAQQMVLLRQPYAYYEMFLCCKDIPERQSEAHTYLYFASLMNIAEAKRDLKDLEQSKLFNPLPFLVYYLYLKQIAQEDLSSLICLMILTIDNSVVPANFNDFAQMLEHFTGCFSNSQLKRVLSSYGLLNNISQNNAYYYSAFYSMFPNDEGESMRSAGDAINGNFDYLLRILTLMDVHESTYTGTISLESCDAKVRVILGKMFEKLAQGKTFLERLLQISWSRSQAFPAFLKEQYKNLIDDTLVISSHMDPAVFEVINTWLTNSFDPYNSTVDVDWCIALRYERATHLELEAFCESLWLNHEIYPSRNLILGAALLSLRSVKGRPYPRLFRSLCRYLANSGEVCSRRYIQLDWDYLGIAPYGAAFEEVVAKEQCQNICKLSEQNKGKTLAQIQEQAIKDQVARYLKLHKEGVDVGDVYNLPKSMVATQEQDRAINSVHAQEVDLNLDVDLQQAHSLDQGKVELNEQQGYVNGNEQSLWTISRADLAHDETYGSSLLDQINGSSEEGSILNKASMRIGDPGTWIGNELYGRNELLNYSFFMQLHGHGGLLPDLLCVKNGWLLGHKANGPMRSYSSYLAKSLLRNETGAFHRYLYYVQSHYFKYRLSEQFDGEDAKSATARKFVNDVLQFKLDSPKFLQFLEEMRKEGIFDFDGLIHDADNGYIQGRYKFVGSSDVDKSSGWRDLFFDVDSELNLERSVAMDARKSLKFIAAKIDRLSEMASGASLDQDTINVLKYGHSQESAEQVATKQQPPQGDKAVASSLTTRPSGAGAVEPSLLESVSALDQDTFIDTVGLGEVALQAKDLGNSHLRMQYGSMQVARELVKDHFISSFLGEDVQRLTDASLSKQWVNYTFYQEPYFNTKHDLLQMLPYTNSILEQCIQDNVGRGLMDANCQTSATNGCIGLVYEPRLIQWRSSILRIRQEENYDSHKVTPDLLLQRFERGYDNALYQINRTRFNILRQAPVYPSSLNAVIDAQAVWATQLNKRSDLLDHGKSFSETGSDFRGHGHSWQNTLLTEDGYDSMLEKRMLQAYLNHSKITDDIFYVSEQNYYKELLNKVVSAAEKNPQLLKSNSTLGLILERGASGADVNYSLHDNFNLADLQQCYLDVSSKMSHQKSLNDSDGGAKVNLFRVKSEQDQDLSQPQDNTDTQAEAVAKAEVKNLETLIKLAQRDDLQESQLEEHLHDKNLHDEVLNENRSSEASLLNHLQSFLSEKMGDMVPPFEGAIKSEKSQLIRDESDLNTGFVQALFKQLWSFDVSAEHQYTRPKMFHEEESPLHTVIYSMVQEYMSEESLNAQFRFANTLMSRLHNAYGYFFGASDVVDSAFAAVIIECFMRRYYREVSLFNIVQHVYELVCEYLSLSTEDEDALMALSHNIHELERLPLDMCAHFGLPKNTKVEDFLNFFIPRFLMQHVKVDPHVKALAAATHEQVKLYPELLMDDSFINQALFDLLTDKELLKYSHAVNGDTGFQYIKNVHQAISTLHKLHLERNNDGELNSLPPLPFVRALSEIDLSLWTDVNEDSSAQLNPNWMRQADTYMGKLLPDCQGYQEESNSTKVLELNYFTPFEQDNQCQAEKLELHYVRPSVNLQESKKTRGSVKNKKNKAQSKVLSEIGDAFAPKLPYDLFKATSSPIQTPLFHADEDHDDIDYMPDISLNNDMLEMLMSGLTQMNLPYEQINNLVSDLMFGKLDIMDLVKMDNGILRFDIPVEYLNADSFKHINAFLKDHYHADHDDGLERVDSLEQSRHVESPTQDHSISTKKSQRVGQGKRNRKEQKQVLATSQDRHNKKSKRKSRNQGQGNGKSHK